MVALKESNLGIPRQLLQAGADPNLFDQKTGQTPLMRAVKQSARRQEVELLLKHGARPNFVAPNGKSALDVINLESKRRHAAENEGLKWLKHRGFKIRLIAPTPEQIEREKHARELYKALAPRSLAEAIAHDPFQAQQIAVQLREDELLQWREEFV